MYKPAAMRPLLPALLLLSSCSVVRMSRVIPTWDSEEASRIKRVIVVVQPLPDGNEKVGAMFARVARRYVHMKRNFLVKADVARVDSKDRAADCADAMDGVLWLTPQVRAVGEGVEANVKASLLRCSDGGEVWAAEAGGSFPSRDEGLKEVAASYAQENGAEVEKYVPAALNVLRPMLDTLPQPSLTEADVEEKMTLDE
jgi:probable lipoprotein (TIGR04455 family)